MNVGKIKCWAMIIFAAVILVLAVWQSVVDWKPCCSTGWVIWGLDVLCAIISVAYIAKYALLLKRSKQR